MILVAYPGIATSSSVDLLLAAGEVAVIAALAITILVKTGPAHYSAAVFSPTSSPHGQFSDITNAMIYGISAFAGFEAAAALGEEARDSRRSVPAATIAVVLVTGLLYLLVVLAETFGTGRHGIAGLAGSPARWVRVPRPVPVLAAPAAPGRSRRAVLVPALGNPSSARIYPGGPAALRSARMAMLRFTSTEVVYGVTGTDVTVLPEYGVSP